MSAIIREMLSEPNDAYIDYKRALEIFPDNTFLQQDVVRLAKELQMTDDIQAFPPTMAALSTNTATQVPSEGELIVFFEDGLVPKKEGIRIPIPLTSGLTGVAFPIYNSKWNDPQPLLISSDGTDVGQSQPVCYVGSLAVKALRERVPTMVLRQVVRSTVKGVAAKAAKDHAGGWGMLGATAYNVLTEQPDTRSWISLPENAQILRASLPAGTHTISLRQTGAAGSGDTKVRVQAGQKTILRVIRAGDRLVSQTLWAPAGAASPSTSTRRSETPQTIQSTPQSTPAPGAEIPAQITTAPCFSVAPSAPSPAATRKVAPQSKLRITVTRTPSPHGPTFSVTEKDTGRVLASGMTDLQLNQMFPGAWARFHRPVNRVDKASQPTGATSE
jgi:hypothetical protein